ncbi:MAG: N-acetylmuramoyl-L-alanine amidase CwlD [Clostridium sp.]|jgi:N-acetylmuramoyl-L-alanine amidase|uniref:N-acetylmuramoyl-L-alanine amidase CwlD n=1 Tax=Clostridium tertium TaxID=1559 RepID=A0A9X3XHK4_9CLOT|nr:MULTISPECIES: N-acetylmuramoyl-L-alanine amidase CwlD [Clostridium]EEH96458.1 N-acetylmuramoyl-L-alanine amidase CwlD [Clostridium sp. 7_2_43FAA]MBP1868241.1 N-acetylmuramoyl-L-alanine amidase [Clostridium tertium]MBS6502925.1 N-acetylmuramoyl-L-alanine amidase CwlD [Clostridium sp.]MBU6133970.1 N-acetylmuramoyl-L-alanine amidase CwlD [Clostridium tertium]MDB1939740.1 N-acetylmuramoyl-L-alanine amidase CwlD [Clostridium tertium]
MKKLQSIILCITISLLCFTPIEVFAEEANQKIILIDPGHGGFDGGAKSKSGVIEKDINLQISLKLKDALEQKGYKVYLTREGDQGLEEKGSTIKEKKREDLKKRRDLKAETKCDIFVSIHQNMFPQAKCFGAQVWHASNDISKKLADDIQGSLKEVVKDNNKRVSKPAGDSYLILRDKYEGASVLVECGFLSNPEEEQRLQTEEHQNSIVEGISLGIEKYFEEINKTSN